MDRKALKKSGLEKQPHLGQGSLAGPSNGLQDEITFLRTLIRQLKTIADETEELNEKIRALRALGSASTQLAYLLKAQQSLAAGKEVELEKTLSQALTEVMEEMKRRKS